MSNFKYVPKREVVEVKKEIIELINLVQNEVRDQFTFRYDFIGSSQLNCVTCDYSSNVGFDLDVNLRVNDDEGNFSAEEIKRILINGFNKYNHLFKFDYCEDSSRVITIKVKDRNNSKILHSCDFAVVYDCSDGRQQYIRFNKNQNSYVWEYQPKGSYQLDERIAWIKKNNLWNVFLELYLEKKNLNQDPNKKSRSLRAEAVNEIYNSHNH